MSGIVGGAGSKSGIIGETEIDYEEGTFTPYLGASGGGGNYGHTQADGAYVKVGKSVTFHIKIAVASDASGGSGYAVINSLPFTVANEGAQIGAGIGFAGNWDGYEPDTWTANPNTNQITLAYHNNNNYWYAVNASITDGNSYIQFCGSYKST
tara:strand:+ start:65 stop:523 length:459 start_codon:yes stop_codon:yes gene_type:complete